MERKQEQYPIASEFEHDTFFVAALIRAAELNLEEEGNMVEEASPAPEALQRRIRDAFADYHRRERGKARRAVGRKVGKRIFYVAAVAALLTCLLYATVSGFRNGLYNATQDISDGISSVIFKGSGSVGVTKQAFSGIVPDGFACVENKTTIQEDYAKYKSEDNYFAYRRQLLNFPEAGADISAELGKVFLTTTVNDSPAQISHNGNGEIVVAWYTDINLYTITTTLNQEYILNIARSIPTT